MVRMEGILFGADLEGQAQDQSMATRHGQTKAVHPVLVECSPSGTNSRTKPPTACIPTPFARHLLVVYLGL